MSTAIEELYNEKHTDYGRLSTPDLRMFAEPEKKSPVISCVDIFEHIQNCPVCSKLYTYNNPNYQSTDYQVTENYRTMKEPESKNSRVYMALWAVFLFLVFSMLIVLLVSLFRDKKSSKLFHSPSYRSK